MQTVHVQLSMQILEVWIPFGRFRLEDITPRKCIKVTYIWRAILKHACLVIQTTLWYIQSCLVTQFLKIGLL